MYLVSLYVACVAGRRKGGKGQNDCGSIERKGGGKGPASYFFFVHQTNVKILIGQIL